MDEKQNKVLMVMRHLKKIMESRSGESSHDIDHTMRVYNMCISLAEKYPDVDMCVLKTSALLHDIARVDEDNDKTRTIDHAILGGKLSENILRKMGYDENDIIKIVHCISTHRFRSDRKPCSIEAKILYDADKLDVIGAVGIARSYMYAGKYGQKIYLNVDVDEFVKDNILDSGNMKDVSIWSPNIEFENKVRLLPDKLFTEEARKIAHERVKYVEQYFERLKQEIYYYWM